MEESVDGVHITEKANELVAEAVWSAMEDELPRFSKPSRRPAGSRLVAQQH